MTKRRRKITTEPIEFGNWHPEGLVDKQGTFTAAAECVFISTYRLVKSVCELTKVVRQQPTEARRLGLQRVLSEVAASVQDVADTLSVYLRDTFLNDLLPQYSKRPYLRGRRGDNRVSLWMELAREALETASISLGLPFSSFQCRPTFDGEQVMYSDDLIAWANLDRQLKKLLIGDQEATEPASSEDDEQAISENHERAFSTVYGDVVFVEHRLRDEYFDAPLPQALKALDQRLKAASPIPCSVVRRGKILWWIEEGPRNERLSYSEACALAAIKDRQLTDKQLSGELATLGLAKVYRTGLAEMVHRRILSNLADHRGYEVTPRFRTLDFAQLVEKCRANPSPPRKRRKQQKQDDGGPAN